MDAHGCPWSSRDAHGCPWMPMDADGCLWAPMDADVPSSLLPPPSIHRISKISVWISDECRKSKNRKSNYSRLSTPPPSLLSAFAGVMVSHACPHDVVLLQSPSSRCMLPSANLQLLCRSEIEGRRCCPPLRAFNRTI